MSIILPALLSLSVTAISSLLGVGSPLGWLWTRIMEAQGYFIASAKTSLGCTTEAEREHPVAAGSAAV